MSTTLKLSGIRTYMSALLYHINLQKGDVIRVSDDVAGKIGGLHRMSDNDGIKVFYFESVPDSTPLNYDFTNPAVLAAAINRAVDSDYMRKVAADATKEPAPVVVETAETAAPKETPMDSQADSTADKPAESAGTREPEAQDAAAPAVPAETPAAPVAPVAARKRAGQRAATK